MTNVYTAKRTLTYRHRGVEEKVTIFAASHGGAYIELTFGFGEKPIEVINMHDYSTGENSRDMHSDSAVSAELTAWIKTQDDEEDGPRRQWLRTYVENS